MNTGPGSKNDNASPDVKVITHVDINPKDIQVERIEESLQGERQGRNRERFIGLIIIIILLDMLAFQSLSWFADTLIFVLELIVVLVAAELCGIDGIYPIIQNAIDSVRRLHGGTPGGPGGR